MQSDNSVERRGDSRGLCRFPLEGFIRLDHLRRIVAGPQSRKNRHMNLDECINDLCREIGGERDGPKLLQLIEQLNCALELKEELIDNTVTEEKAHLHTAIAHG